MTPERYAEKLAAAKAELGEKYILHPKNRVRRKTPKKPELQQPRSKFWAPC